MKHVREMDGLRGLLALWVFATHVLELGPYPSAANYVQANLAVDLFIILSGFVIFHLLSNGEDFRTFITRRWFRLFPVFAVCFLLAAALYASLRTSDKTAFAIEHQRHVLPYLIAHATMLHGAVPNEILPDSARAILPPAWSISVEWQFYLIAPLLFMFAVKPTRKTTAFFLLILGLRALCEIGQRTGRLTFDMQAFVPQKLEYFALGAGSYALWQWLAKRTQPLRMPRLMWALLAPVLLLVSRQNIAMGLWLVLMLALVNVHFGAITRPTRMLRGALNCRAAQFLGKTSYCIYLLHLPALVLVRQLFSWNDLAVRAPVQQALLIIGGLTATITGAWLLHVLIEQPLIRYGKRLTQSWRTPAPSSHPIPTVA
jgi:peptidoglycan/LPS O-acetylase OafA/YrhL